MSVEQGEAEHNGRWKKPGVKQRHAWRQINSELMRQNEALKCAVGDERSQRIMQFLYGRHRTESEEFKRLTALSNLDVERNAVVGRLIEYVHTSPPEIAVNVAYLLARIGGWLSPTQIHAKTQSMNLSLHQLISDPGVRKALIEQLAHEPGEAKAVDSGIDDPEPQ